MIRLTALGRAEFRAMAAEHEGWIAAMFAGLDAGEVAALMRLLGRTKNSVRRETGP